MPTYHGYAPCLAGSDHLAPAWTYVHRLISLARSVGKERDTETGSWWRHPAQCIFSAVLLVIGKMIGIEAKTETAANFVRTPFLQLTQQYKNMLIRLRLVENVLSMYHFHYFYQARASFLADSTIFSSLPLYRYTYNP